MTDPTTVDPGRLPRLAAALARVQAELPELERDRTVTVTQKTGGTYSYSYATLANVSRHVLPLLAKHGLAFTALPGLGGDGKMSLRYMLLHESGEQLAGEFPISGEGGIQMIGGRITYARRYVLAALVGVAADEDDEARLDEASRGVAQRATPARRPAAPQPATPQPTAQRRPPGPPPPLPTDEETGDEQITPAQQRKMHALLREMGLADRDAGLAYISETLERDITTTRELSRVDAARVIDRLEHWAAAEQPPDGERS